MEEKKQIIQETINETLVEVFNRILRIEEDMIKSFGSDLSIKEAHVIEAAAKAGVQGTLSFVAAQLGVTAGSLTVAVKTLENKGYLTRIKSETDKRRIHIHLTPKALHVNRLHAQFHQEMTQAVIEAIPEEQLNVLVQALKTVNAYFSNYGGDLT